MLNKRTIIVLVGILFIFNGYAILYSADSGKSKLDNEINKMLGQTVSDSAQIECLNYIIQHYKLLNGKEIVFPVMRIYKTSDCQKVKSLCIVVLASFENQIAIRFLTNEYYSTLDSQLRDTLWVTLQKLKSHKG